MTSHKDKVENEWKRLSEFHFERSNSLSGWLLTNLVLVNGGAAAALAARVSPTDPSPARPALLFAGGVVLALVSGFLRAQAHFDRSGVYYRKSQEPAESRADSAPGAPAIDRRAGLLDLGALLINICSLAAFVVALLWTAWPYLS